MNLKGKTVFITGASRGIGKAIALKLAAEGANIIIAAKSVKEDPRLGGTIYSAAKEIESLGVKALPVQCDIRNEQEIEQAVSAAVAAFGGIDVLINNASAINLNNTEKLSSKYYDLMQDINVRGTFMVGKYCIPYLKKAPEAHIISMSPPLNLKGKWLGAHVAYTVSKYGMTMVTLGWAEELKDYNIASNTLWPKTTIDTAAVRNLLGGEALANRSRKPQILADAALAILKKDKTVFNGQSLIDEEVLMAEGIRDFKHYAVNPDEELYVDLFLDR